MNICTYIVLMEILLYFCTVNLKQTHKIIRK